MIGETPSPGAGRAVLARPRPAAAGPRPRSGPWRSGRGIRRGCRRSWSGRDRAGTGSSSGMSRVASMPAQVSAPRRSARRRGGCSKASRVSKITVPPPFMKASSRRIAASRRLRPSGDDGPVEQRIERDLVPRRIDADRLARLQGRALARSTCVSPVRPALLVSIHLRVAGDHIGQAGHEGGLELSIVASAAAAPARRRGRAAKSTRQPARSDRRRRAGPAQAAEQVRQMAAEPERGEGVERGTGPAPA